MTNITKIISERLDQELNNLVQQFLEAIPKELEEDNAMGLNNIQNNGFNACREERKKNLKEIIKDL